MVWASYSEQQAFRKLEQLASQEQRKVSEVAATILAATNELEAIALAHISHTHRRE